MSEDYRWQVDVGDLDACDFDLRDEGRHDIEDDLIPWTGPIKKGHDPIQEGHDPSGSATPPNDSEG